MPARELTQADILHMPFDIELHKKYFHNYLEVVILRDGTVEYAVPSHSEKLISVIVKDTGRSREEISNMCPPEYYCDYGKWLAMQSGAIAVWDRFCMGCELSPAQIETLQKLKAEGLYHGKIKPM